MDLKVFFSSSSFHWLIGGKFSSSISPALLLKNPFLPISPCRTFSFPGWWPLIVVPPLPLLLLPLGSSTPGAAAAAAEPHPIPIPLPSASASLTAGSAPCRCRMSYCKTHDTAMPMPPSRFNRWLQTGPSGTIKRNKPHIPPPSLSLSSFRLLFFPFFTFSFPVSTPFLLSFLSSMKPFSTLSPPPIPPIPKDPPQSTSNITVPCILWENTRYLQLCWLHKY